jgi:Zn-dependent protease with chaperone function
MFTQIIFLITILLLISFAPQPTDNPWVPLKSSAFFYGMAAYGGVIGLIGIQNLVFAQKIRKWRNVLLTLSNGYLIVFFILFHFFLTAQRVLPHSSFIVAAFSLFLYLSALFFFHYTAYASLPMGTRGTAGTPFQYALQQIRLLIPFSLPFLLFSLIFDLILLLPSDDLQNLLLMPEESLIGTVTLFGFTLLVLLLVLLFFPPLTIKIWRCKDLAPSPLASDLLALCRKAHFKHAGMKTWTVLNHSYTAGIIGILPRFRYVMFTKRLLSDLSPRSIIAILAHEIGHSARKHLLIYPFILMGMIVMTALFSILFGETVAVWFSLNDYLYPSPIWKAIYPLALFFLHALILILYFRLVFGYFSRLFERQADLHVFELDLPPDDMQLALDELGHISGGTHLVPCWHHHSIQKRIDFLETVKKDRDAVGRHHRKVRIAVAGYFAGLVLLLTALFFSPDETGRQISDFVNASLQKKIAEKLVLTYRIPDNEPEIQEAVFQAIQNFGALLPHEILAFAATDILYQEGNIIQSAVLLKTAWEMYKPAAAPPELTREFSLLTEQILGELQGSEKQELEKAYRHAKDTPEHP